MTAPIGSPRRWASPVAHLSGLACVFLAAGMLVSAGVGLASGGGGVGALVVSAVVVGTVGGAAWRLSSVPPALAPGRIFAMVFGVWVAMSVAGALPYLLSGTFDTFDDALFESVSGITATGSTVLGDIESTEPGILFWRQMTQWFGGMGVVVLAVAVLPFLGVGGLDLIRAEAPGPTSDRLAPRVSETAKRLWLVYVGLTAVFAVGLTLAGMSPRDGVEHAFSLVSTGGFSPYETSIGHFDSVPIEVVVQIGMVIGAVNFALHWRAVQGDPGGYLRSSELRVFLGLLVTGVAAVTLLQVGDGIGWLTTLRDSAFNVVSLGTSTGYTNASPANPGADYVLWAASAQLVLLFFMFCGAMTGSTSGGMKVLRLSVMARFAQRELRRARSPRAVLPVRTGAEPVPDEIVARIAGFVLLYVVIAGAGTVVVTGLGADLVTAMGGVASAMGNMGPALGEAGPTSDFLVYPRPARLLLMLLMLVGRLELFAVMVPFALLARTVRRETARPVRVRRART